mmetsp:Transcript_20094/g.51258  ORF Transcript_20094/g.51258 Transcript_20094/m.51258 type:complete len:115 (-) Transcript_20094:492-836(-)
MVRGQRMHPCKKIVKENKAILGAYPVFIFVFYLDIFKALLPGESGTTSRLSLFTLILASWSLRPVARLSRSGEIDEDVLQTAGKLSLILMPIALALERSELILYTCSSWEISVA